MNFEQSMPHMCECVRSRRASQENQQRSQYMLEQKGVGICGKTSRRRAHRMIIPFHLFVSVLCVIWSDQNNRNSISATERMGRRNCGFNQNGRATHTHTQTLYSERWGAKAGITQMDIFVCIHHTQTKSEKKKQTTRSLLTFSDKTNTMPVWATDNIIL